MGKAPGTFTEGEGKLPVLPGVRKTLDYRLCWQIYGLGPWLLPLAESDKAKVSPSELPV